APLSCTTSSLTPATASGTLVSATKAELASNTRAPASIALGTYSTDTVGGAAKKTRSTCSKSNCSNNSTRRCLSSTSKRSPAELIDASKYTSEAGKHPSLMSSIKFEPTKPVAPTM